MVPAPSHWVPRAPWYSGTRFLPSSFAYGAFTLFGRPSQRRSAAFRQSPAGPYPGALRAPVWAPPISLAATLGITFVFFSSGYLDVSVHRVPSHALWIHPWVRKFSLRGFPHSDTRGSLGICPSPRLFAAYRVFLRPAVPRHPPCALLCLAISLRLAWRSSDFFLLLFRCLVLGCFLCSPVFGFQGTNQYFGCFISH